MCWGGGRGKREIRWGSCSCQGRGERSETPPRTSFGAPEDGEKRKKTGGREKKEFGNENEGSVHSLARNVRARTHLQRCCCEETLDLMLSRRPGVRLFMMSAKDSAQQRLSRTVFEFEGNAEYWYW